MDGAPATPTVNSTPSSETAAMPRDGTSSTAASSAASTPVTAEPQVALSPAEELLVLVQNTTLTIVQGVDEAINELGGIAQLEDTFIHAHLPAFTQAVFRETSQLWTKLSAAMLARDARRVRACRCMCSCPATLADVSGGFSCALLRGRCRAWRTSHTLGCRPSRS